MGPHAFLGTHPRLVPPSGPNLGCHCPWGAGPLPPGLVGHLGVGYVVAIEVEGGAIVLYDDVLVLSWVLFGCLWTCWQTIGEAEDQKITQWGLVKRRRLWFTLGKTARPTALPSRARPQCLCWAARHWVFSQFRGESPVLHWYGGMFGCKQNWLCSTEHDNTAT